MFKDKNANPSFEKKYKPKENNRWEKVNSSSNEGSDSFGGNVRRCENVRRGFGGNVQSGNIRSDRFASDRFASDRFTSDRFSEDKGNRSSESRSGRFSSDRFASEDSRFGNEDSFGRERSGDRFGDRFSDRSDRFGRKGEDSQFSGTKNNRFGKNYKGKIHKSRFSKGEFDAKMEQNRGAVQKSTSFGAIIKTEKVKTIKTKKINKNKKNEFFDQQEKMNESQKAFILNSCYESDEEVEVIKDEEIISF
tara:strand:+ start:175 stop:921 length:747 start_codon:yes stop_codon:yes gene_type:complete